MTDIVRPTIDKGESTEEVMSGFKPLTMIFFFSYVVLVYVIMLNVTVSVLLEGFLSAVADMEQEEMRQVNCQIVEWCSCKPAQSASANRSHLSLRLS